MCEELPLCVSHTTSEMDYSARMVARSESEKEAIYRGAYTMQREASVSHCRVSLFCSSLSREPALAWPPLTGESLTGACTGQSPFFIVAIGRAREKERVRTLRLVRTVRCTGRYSSSQSRSNELNLEEANLPSGNCVLAHTHKSHRPLQRASSSSMVHSS